MLESVFRFNINEMYDPIEALRQESDRLRKARVELAKLGELDEARAYYGKTIEELHLALDKQVEQLDSIAKLFFENYDPETKAIPPESCNG